MCFHALGDEDVVSGCTSVETRYFEAASGRVVPRGMVGVSGADEVKTVAAGELERASSLRERAGGAAGFESDREGGSGTGRWQGRTQRLILTTTAITMQVDIEAHEQARLEAKVGSDWLR
jgi:hypothetical protein